MTHPTKPYVTMRFEAPAALNYRLHNLASKLQVPVRDLLMDGVHLAMRFHGDGFGIPQPPVRLPPSMGDVDVGEGGSA